MDFGSIIKKSSLTTPVFSNTDPATKMIYRERYRKLKKSVSVGSIATVSIVSFKELLKDVAASKLKSFGYKVAIGTLVGPLLQTIALPIYVWTYTGRIKKFSIAVMEVGAAWSRGEVEIACWSMILLDFLLFGEYVSTTESENWMFLRNETDSILSEVVNSIGD